MDIENAAASSRPGLDTVRALHQTVVALRAALEKSKCEITKLKSQAWPLESVQDALKALSIENHILREHVISSKQGEDKCVTENLKSKKVHSSASKHKRSVFEARITVKAESKRKQSRSLESLTVFKSPIEASKQLSFSKTVSFSNLPHVTREVRYQDINNENPKMSNNKEVISPQANDLDQEVDDIELIFTTEDTKESDFKEQLVSIEPDENALHLPLSDFDQEISDRELEDDVFNDNLENGNNQENANISFEAKRENSIFNSKSDNSINHDENKSLKSYYSSYQDSSFENKSIEKDESFDRFEERVRIVETDISKCGIHEVEYVSGRRNTCPNPVQYRPLSHRDAMMRGFNSRKCRPILTHSSAMRRDSGAQTDISALPGSSWRSESSLANKARLGDNFTMLPSKFPMPGSRLKLSEKNTVEARRVLLSDIGFTSMVPELSRSADYLCPPNLKPPTVTTYGQFLRTTDLYSPAYTSQKFVWTTTSPSDGSQTQSRYSSIYPLTSPPAPSRRCSAPVSPSRRAVLKSALSKVRFATNGSLPELRGDWDTTADSSDSTESLVEEAENYLRRSIDCIGTGRDISYSESHKSKSSSTRRASAPEPDRDNVPPNGWQPFLPRIARDLKLDYWIKVITPEGRVRGGRVRYVGPILSQADQFVGVQLGCSEGNCDGTYNGRRYFQCEPYYGIFVPFKKVIMGWRP